MADKRNLVQDPATITVKTIQRLLQRRDNGHCEVGIDSEFHDDLGLDSLELAELSATLEEEFGRDPYTEGVVPRTVREVVAFYDQ